MGLRQKGTGKAGASKGTKILLKGGRLLNVYSGELLEMDVLTEEERISYIGTEVGPVEDTTVLDVKGRVIVPGYIEPHCHPWLTYNPLSFAEEACRLGTTTLFCDDLIFYMLMGRELFEEFMEAFRALPVKLFWLCRAVPQTPMRGERDLFSAENVGTLLQNPLVQSLGEITRWPELCEGNPTLLEMIRCAKALKRRVDGHTAGARYDKLNAISRAGVDSCHESIDGREAMERLRLGMYVMARESSLRQDLAQILRTIMEEGAWMDRVMLTTDASTPSFHRRFGVTDHLLRVALREGVDPLLAYRMVTLTPAEYYGLDGEIGGIAPGRYADILVLEDLLNPTPEVVIAKGKIVAERGELLEPFPRIDWKRFLPKSTFSARRWKARESLFEIPYGGRRLRFPTLRLINTVITRIEWVEFEAKDGALQIRPEEGFSLLSLLSRDGTWVSNGVLRGYGRVQGLASSFNTATQILAIGCDPGAMSVAVNRVLEIKGGIVAVEDGRVVYEFPLPLGGMMSEAPMEALAEKDEELQRYLYSKGFPFHDPLYTLIFLPNDFLPEGRVNYHGVVDIKRGEVLWPRRDLIP